MLARNMDKAMVAGVAAGIADKLGVSAFLVRTLFVAGFFLFGLGLLLYWWFWASMPGQGTSNQIRMDFSH